MVKKFIEVKGSVAYELINGIYQETETLVNGKKQFLLTADEVVQKIEWHNVHNQWQIISNGGSALLVSNVDTESPEDPANVWVVDIDNSGDPAGITVEVVEFPNLVVTEAGTTKVNDLYTILSVVDNKPNYVKAGTHQVGDSIYISYNKVSKQWEVLGKEDYEGGEKPILYESIEDLLTPDLVTKWTTNTGTAPTPVFTLASTSVFVCNASIAVKRHRG